MKKKSRNYLPRYFDNKEYESNLSEARIQIGLTIRELCEKINISTGVYSVLNSGMSSPIDRHGKLKEPAKRLADILCMDLSDLWPRYFCDITKHDELTPDQIVEVFHQGLMSPEFEDPEERLIRKERYEELDRILSRLTYNQRETIMMRFIKDKTQKETGKHLNTSTSRIGQIEHEALGRLNYHFKRNARFRYLFFDVEPEGGFV
jgi:RNA polymerase sigma factor (sigma-70 family)